MTTARTVLLSALMVTLAIVGAAWWTSRPPSQSERYQLVNVGQGQTQRLDRLTGDVIACRDAGCSPIILGGKVTPPTLDSEALPPGFEIESIPEPKR